VTASDRSAQHNGRAASNGNAAAGVGADANGVADIPPLLATYAGTNGLLADIRADVARWFTGRGFSADATDRAILLTSELCSNAIEAGPGHPLDLRITPVAGARRRAVIAVTNTTTLGNVPPPSERWAPSDPLAPRGRGLAIVDALSDQVLVDTSVPGRVTVVAHISD